MQTGIELITEERDNQINKHEHTIESDVKFNSNNELLSAIMMLAASVGFKRSNTEIPKEVFEDLRPETWGRESCFKFLNKSEIEQLQIIGAFAAAEIDRLQAIQNSQDANK